MILSSVRRFGCIAAVVFSACTEGGPLAAPAVPVVDEPDSTGKWASVSVGGAHTCALDVDGRAYCWGSNEKGQLGVRETRTKCQGGDDPFDCSSAPMLVGSGVRFRAISAGANHTCAIAMDESAYCWGDNSFGQLGDVGFSGPAVTRVGVALTFVSVSSGANHTCGVRFNGSLYCWGGNDRGQIGNGTIANIYFALPVGGNTRYTTVAAGQGRTCARTTLGVVHCWGSVWLERRSDGVEFLKTQTTPEIVPSAPALVGVSTGWLTTCGYDATGFGYCWEANPRGQMGTGDTEGSRTPRRISSLAEFKSMSSGLLQTCAVTVTGEGYCWGDNSFGQLGAGVGGVSDRCSVAHYLCSMTPHKVFGQHEWASVQTGLGSHSCGITTRRILYCWGLGTSGQRGDGTIRYTETYPTRIVAPR